MLIFARKMSKKVCFGAKRGFYCHYCHPTATTTATT